jgi:hypothetical protein
VLLAGGDFLSDRSLIADPATAQLRGVNALPSVPTLWRFLAGADLGWVAKAAAVNRVMLRRAWAAGAAPEGDRLTIDPDATRVATYGPGKEGSAFSRTGQTALLPLVGALGETGDVLALRARGGAANDGRAMGSFIDECVRAIPVGARDAYRLWIRVDSAGYQEAVIEAAERHQADYSVTAKGYANVTAAVHALAADPATTWVAAQGHESGKGSQVAETTTTLLERTVRLIVRRQPKQAGEQLAFDDLDGWRLHAIITNVDAEAMTAAEVEAHHRLRGGIPEDTIRALKNDFGMIPGRSVRSSATGCTGRPPPWPTTSGCGCVPWPCPARPPGPRQAAAAGLPERSGPADPPRPPAGAALHRRLPPPASLPGGPGPPPCPTHLRLAPPAPSQTPHRHHHRDQSRPQAVRRPAASPQRPAPRPRRAPRPPSLSVPDRPRKIDSRSAVTVRTRLKIRV